MLISATILLAEAGQGQAVNSEHLRESSGAARTIYARVEKQELERPGSNYALAQQRLAAMKHPTATTAKNGQ